MDRTSITTCAGAALVGAAIGFYWTQPEPPRSSSRAEAPRLLEVGSGDQCSWKRLDENLSVNFPPIADATAEKPAPEPPVTAAEPLVVGDDFTREPAGESEIASDLDAGLPPVASSSLAGPPASHPAEHRPLARSVRIKAVSSPEEGMISTPSRGSEPATTTMPEPSVQHAPMPAPAPQPAPRSPEMMAVLTRADQSVRHGFELARHGALYSARAEFIAALQLIADANDAHDGTNVRSRALAAGLTAVKEAALFVRHTAGRGGLDVQHIVATHKTPILKDTDAAGMSATVAAQRYYSYAQEQLAIAASREMNASMALYGLAKVASTVNATHGTQPIERTAQTMTYHQAALMADSGNFLSANELAVLEVANGNLQRARELLIHSVSISPHPTTWRNLSVVHSRLGETQLAEQANAQYLAMPKPTSNGPLPPVQFLDPTSFAQTTSPSDGLVPPLAAANPAPTTPPAPSKVAKSRANTLSPGKLQR